MACEVNNENRPIRILVVDDDVVSQSLVLRRLSKEGYETAGAQSGSEAIDMVEEAPPNLILLDLMMPGMSGLEVLERIREIREKSFLPVIMMSARTEVTDKVDAFTKGADDYVTKPFNFEELLARIRAQLRISELQRKLVDAERSRGVYEMAAAVCHELAQPLTVLIGYTQMLLRKADGENRRVLQQVHEAAQRSAEIVRKIQRVRRYQIKDYTTNTNIIDLDLASEGEEPNIKEGDAEKRGGGISRILSP